jgi:ATP-binding cassette subfamily B protein
MWNRQREADAAREKLALMSEEPGAPNRNPPSVEDALTKAAAAPLPASPADATVDAAE